MDRNGLLENVWSRITDRVHSEKHDQQDPGWLEMLEWIRYSLVTVIFIAWVFMTVRSHDTHALSYPFGKMKENFLDIR